MAEYHFADCSRIKGASFAHGCTLSLELAHIKELVYADVQRPGLFVSILENLEESF